MLVLLDKILEILGSGQTDNINKVYGNVSMPVQNLLEAVFLSH